jgi:hypothetical protein
MNLQCDAQRREGRWPPNGRRESWEGRGPGGTRTDYTYVFALVSGTSRDEDGQRGTGSLGLITRRSQVQILPPLLIRPDS